MIKVCKAFCVAPAKPSGSMLPRKAATTESQEEVPATQVLDEGLYDASGDLLTRPTPREDISGRQGLSDSEDSDSGEEEEEQEEEEASEEEEDSDEMENAGGEAETGTEERSEVFSHHAFSRSLFVM